MVLLMILMDACLDLFDEDVQREVASPFMTQVMMRMMIKIDDETFDDEDEDDDIQDFDKSQNNADEANENRVVNDARSESVNQ